MNPGVCIRPYTPHGYLAPIPLPSAYRFADPNHPGLHDVGIRVIRSAGGGLVQSAKPPATIDDSWGFDFDLLHQWLLPIGGAMAGEVWMEIYLNPGGCPPAASEGQPAYVDELGVSRWPPTSPETDASYVGGAWWNDRNNPGLGVHDFNQDPNRTDSVTVNGKVITGPELAAIDAKMPPRPYLLNPPHRDPRYAFDLGRAIMQDYLGNFLMFVGSENEPGGGLLARWEDRGHLGAADVMRDRMFPEIYIPFAEGVRSARPSIAVADVNKGVRIVGCEADSADILARFLDADEERYRGRPSLSVCDKISIHPYGAIAGGPSYATMEEFTKVIKGRQSYREVSIGEIGGDPQALYDFTLEVVAKSGKEWPVISDVIYLEPSMFYEPGSSWTTLGPWDAKKSVLSAVGLKFKTLFAKMNNSRRSA